MSLKNPSRRSILAAAGAGLATFAPGLRVAFAADPPFAGSPAPADILIVMFMRGGQDGLQLVAPAGADEYIQHRPSIRVMSDGPNRGLGAGTLDGVDFYFHPALGGLKSLYDAGKLAVVQAVGVPTIDRSHFVVQNLMEQGLGDNEVAQGATGWLARHIASRGGVSQTLATVASGTAIPESLGGVSSAVAIPDPVYFDILGGDRDTAALIRAANGGADPYQVAVRSLVDTVNMVQDKRSTMLAAGITTSDLSAYGYSSFGDALHSLASLIKMDLGLQTATIDMASWDHHTELAGAFTQIATDLSQALSAFWQDIAAYQGRVTIVTMTEFGRRFTQNSDAGLDHGAASTMLVMGGNVTGGRIYGHWPGLSPNALDNDSLRVTTDYRQVLAELIVKRHGEPNLSRVFPNLTYAPLGVVTGG